MLWLLQTNKLDFNQFSNWEITSAENMEASIEKFRALILDLIVAVGKQFWSWDLTAKLQKIANLQQSDVPVFFFLSVADIIDKSNQTAEELKQYKTTELLFTDNMFHDVSFVLQ